MPTIPLSVIIFNKKFIVFWIALSLWFISRPYLGIRHDGVFYALQALFQIEPEIYSYDLFFAYGSQNQYTLFSLIYATVVEIFGLERAVRILTELGLLAWFMGAVAFVRVLPFWIGMTSLLLIATVPANYGSHFLLSYGENFLTARLYAEALSLAGLAGWLNGRLIWGSLAFIAAVLIHPIMALPALIIGLSLVIPFTVWWKGLAAAAGVGVILGFIGISPFTGLVQPMDDVWWNFTVSRSPFVFLHTWQWVGFSQALFTAVVMGVAWRILPEGPLCHLARGTLVCITSAFALAYVGGSVLKLPLIAGLQLWRILWIGQITVLLLVPALITITWRDVFWRKLMVLGLASALLLDTESQGMYSLLVVAVAILGAGFLPDHYKPPFWVWLLLSLVLLLIGLFGILNLLVNIEMRSLLQQKTQWYIYLTHPLSALALLSSCYWLFKQDRIYKPYIWIGAAIAAGLLTSALLTWDQTSSGLRYEAPNRQAVIAPVKARIPPNAIVYWVGELENTWFWLGRANYLSFHQSAGSVFSRGNAVEALRRSEYVQEASWQDSNYQWDAHPQTTSQQPFTELALTQVCQDPILGYVITKDYLIKPPMLRFKDPYTGFNYALYDCQQERQITSTTRVSTVE